MCLIAWAVGMSSRWPLVIAANRDEYWARPTLPMAPWTTRSGQRITSGRDGQTGGTWMGMTPAGRIAFLTNVREAGGLDPLWRSRGELVTRWLEGLDSSAEDLVRALQSGARGGREFGGFNLVLGDVATGEWHWVSNRLDGARVPPELWPSRRLAPGVYGVSNAALNTPWPKTVQLTATLADALTCSDTSAQLEAALWSALASRVRCTPHQLPNTGVPQATELALSSVCVDFPEMAYGTRSSTVLIASAPQGQVNRSTPWAVSVEEHTHAAGATSTVQRLATTWQGI
ncbi:MAG: NRDE family protein [Polaromonas sp.]|nr:NRDE family protein [Polaromonas sp.]